MRKITSFIVLMLSFIGHSQINTYNFSQSTETYTEIGGASLGATNTANKLFFDTTTTAGVTTVTGAGISIGFDFVYNGIVYDQFAIASNGWIGLGPKSLGNVDMGTGASTNKKPISSYTSTVSQEPYLARISGMTNSLGLYGQTNASIQTQTIADPNNPGYSICVVQWKNYKPNISGGGGSINFQIRLNQIDNSIKIIYGNCVINNPSSATFTTEIGLRTAPLFMDPVNFANFTNRTSATGNWDSTTQGTKSTDALTINSSSQVPANGLVYKWTPPTCSVASNFTVTNLNTSGATISWSPSLPGATGTYPAPSEGYEYIISSTYALPLSTDAGTPTTATSAIITGKDSGTTYYVYFRSKCSGQYTQWAILGTFKTVCADKTTFSENFDSTIINSSYQFLPDCWSRITTGTALASVATSSVSPATAPNRFNMTANGNTTPANTSYLISPSVTNFQGNFQDIPNRLRFKAYSTSTSVAKNIEIGYLTDLANPNSFVSLQTFSNLGTVASSATEYIFQPNQLTGITPASIPAGVKNLVFRNLGTGGFNGVYLDDIFWEEIPPCPNVTALTASITNVSSVTLKWTNDAQTNDAQYVYSTSATANPDSLPATTVTGGNSAIFNIDPGTSYKAWVRSKCTSTGSFGAWVPVAFTTPCSPASSFVQNFDASTNLPACWNKIGITGIANVNAIDKNATTKPNSLLIHTNLVTDNPIISLPSINISDITTNRLRFKASITCAVPTFPDPNDDPNDNVTNPPVCDPNTSLKIGYLKDLNDDTSFVEITSLGLTPGGNYEPYFIDLSTFQITPTTPFLAFKAAGSNTTNVRIDDVVWEKKPTCADVQNINATLIKNNSVSFSWSALSSGTTYQYAYGSPNLSEPDSSLNIYNSDTNAASIFQLNPATTYKLWVRSVCHGSDYGAWSWPVTFTTTCDPIDSFTENFDGTSLPTCWGDVDGTQKYITSGMLTLTAGSTKLGIVAMRPVNVAAPGTHRIKFKFKGNVANANLQLGYLTNPSDPTSFISIKSYSNYANVDSMISEVSELEITGQSQVLAFKNTGTPSSTFYIDDVIWEVIPPCNNIENLKNLGVTHNSVNLTWSEGGTESAWQYALGSSTDNDPNSITPIKDVSSSEIQINDLSASTTYKIWVRSKCSSTKLGAWSTPLVFTTTCDPVSSFNERFDGSANLPNCWYRSGNTGTVQISSIENTPTMPNSLFLYSGSETSTAIVAMPPVSNINGNNRLRFKMKSTAIGAKLEVGYMTNVLDPTTFTVLKPYTATTLANFEDVVAVLDNAPAVGTLAFRNSGIPSSTIYVDDVYWEPIPTCTDASSVIVNSVTNSSASLSWDNNSSSSNKFQYALGESTDSDPNGLTIKNLETNSVNLYELTSSKTYRFWLRTQCTASNGVWIGPITFTTTCGGVDSINEKFDGSTSLPTCWQRSGNLGNVYINDTPNAPSANNTLVIYSASTDNQGTVALPALSNATLNTHRLTFKAKASNENSNLEIGYLVNVADPNSFVSLETAIITSTSTFNDYFVVFNNLPQSQVLALRNQGGEQSSIYLDNVVWEPKPACPDVINPRVSFAKSSTAKIAWNPNFTYKNYQYFLAEASTLEPNANAAIDITGTTVTIDKLDPSTSYKVWVRTKCSDANFGSWTSPLTFTTTCPPVATFTENFENDNSLPTCWTKCGETGEASINNKPLYAVGAHSLSVFSGSISSQGIVAMPAVSNAAAGTHTLKFKAAANTKAILEVGYLLDITNPKSFVFLQTVEMNNSSLDLSLKDYEVAPGTLPQSEVLAFRNSGTVSTNIYIDEVVWNDVPLGVETLDSNGFSYFPNPVKDVLNLSHNQNITSVSLFNLLGQEMITKTVNANQTIIDMSNLPNETYLVKIISENQMKFIKVIKQ